MPNVLVLPQSADYSEEVWMEIREKTISILQMYFLDGAVPSNAVSDDEEEESEITYENEQFDRQDKERALHSSVEQPPAESPMVSASFQGKGPMQLESPSQHQESDLSPSVSNQSDGKRSRSRKKAKKRHGRQKSQNKSEDIVQKEGASQQDDDTAMSGTEQVHSSGSGCASPGDPRSRKTPIELAQESSASLLQKSGKGVRKNSVEQLKDGCIIALHAKELSTLYVSRQRVKGGGWFLDTMSGVTKRDPAAQFLVVFGSKVSVDLQLFYILFRLICFTPNGSPLSLCSCRLISFFVKFF